MAYSHVKSIEYVKHAHKFMILRLICSNCLYKDDFDFVSFSSRLQIFRLIFRFNLASLNIIIGDVLFLEDLSSKVAWSQHVILQFLNLFAIIYFILMDEFEENLKQIPHPIVIMIFWIFISFFLTYHTVKVKNILIKNYTKIHDFSNEINNTFNSIEASMIQFENGGVKFINKNIIRLLHNTLPNDVEIQLLKIGLQSGFKDLKNHDKVDKVVEDFIKMKIFRIYKTPQ